MSRPVFALSLRLRLTGALTAGVGLIAIMAAVGALFPAVGHTIGSLNVPKSVASLLGGADYGTVTGWFRSEIGSIYGPLVAGALAITSASATIAGEEEDQILALVLAHPVTRARLIVSKAVSAAGVVVIVAVSTFLGLIVGVALAGGGVSIGHMAALGIQLAFFGFVCGAIAVAVAAASGRRSLATGVAASVAVLSWLVNSFAPLVSGLEWLKYLSPYYYYAGHDPLTQGLWIGGLAILGAASVFLVWLGIVAFARRDLRG